MIVVKNAEGHGGGGGDPVGDFRSRLRGRAGGLACWITAFEVHNEPVNRPLSDNSAAIVGRDNTTSSDDVMVGLAFSGGGTRAAAFSFGALTEIERTPLPGRAGASSYRSRNSYPGCPVVRSLPPTTA